MKNGLHDKLRRKTTQKVVGNRDVRPATSRLNCRIHSPNISTVDLEECYCLAPLRMGTGGWGSDGVRDTLRGAGGGGVTK